MERNAELARWRAGRFSRAALEKKQQSWWRRIGVFGDLPTRSLTRALKVLPWFLEPVLIPPWTLLFFLIAGPQRRAVAGNLRALFPEWSESRALIGAWQVFLNFSRTYVDALRHETETGEMDWSVTGMEAIQDLRNRDQGCIILTAHMGNYDIAAPLFSSRIGRTIHAVRAPERVPEMQAIREAELAEKERRYPHFRTCFNHSGEMLGVELARILNQGDVVAMQGDRVIFEVSSMDAEVEPGLAMRVPRGPLFLARATGAPVFPIFIVRDGWRRYRVVARPPLELPARVRGGGADPAAILWCETIFQAVRAHWSQWFVFERILCRKKGVNE